MILFSVTRFWKVAQQSIIPTFPVTFSVLLGFGIGDGGWGGWINKPFNFIKLDFLDYCYFLDKRKSASISDHLGKRMAPYVS